MRFEIAISCILGAIICLTIVCNIYISLLWEKNKILENYISTLSSRINDLEKNKEVEEE